MGSGSGQLSASRQMENWVKVVENVRLVNVLAFVKHVSLKLQMQNYTLTLGSCFLNRKIQVQVYKNFI